MAEVPVIQVLDKENYFTQALVPLPDALPLPPLTADSSLRIRTEVLSLTLNNFTYARLGSLLGWWDVHPLPPSAPAPYSDAARYGRTNCWGYASVLESTFAGAPAGSYVWGYLPIGTLPQDVEVEPAGPVDEVPGQITVTSAHRAHVMPVYNRYFVYPPALGADVAARADAVARDAVLRVMHLTGYLLARYAFAPDPAGAVYPGFGADPSPDLDLWGPGESDLGGGCTVVVFAPGSKAALSFAYLLRLRGAEDGEAGGEGAARPRRVIGVASRHSVDFVRRTGVYDEVVCSADADAGAADVLARSGAGDTDKIAVFEFGGRDGAAARWALALQERYARVQFVGVGSELPSEEEEGRGGEARGRPPPTHVGRARLVRANTDDMRRRAIEKVGEGEFYRGLESSWRELRGKGFEGFRVVWGEGMEDVRRGWERLGRGEVGPDEGLVFKV
ncbi:hypothetical protein F5X99DRAFT_423443 [Biscogniauxia marginata]|nr:hypothetical protein F5X99DRAFT_423443 [Biscogniauxia marginata]